jgi:GTP-binding protein
MFDKEKIRNIAIIAHIDHGKTTLLDSLLKQSAAFHDNAKIPERVMDSYDQEKERGITIFSKNTSIFYKDFKINIIDTPGHADFSGEVERVLGMVNSVLLLIDAKEGPMPQTRFVLMKSLQMGLCPIVVLNKVDRPHADVESSLNKTFDLFVELGATDEQLDFKYIYASGLSGYAQKELGDPKTDMKPLLEMITKDVPAPIGDLNAPFLMQVATIAYDSYVGRQACGRILSGVVKDGMQVNCVTIDGTKSTFNIQRIEGYQGLQKVQLKEAGVGDIVIIAGNETVTIGDTLCALDNTVTLPPITIDEPTLSIDIRVNSGPFAGKHGKNLTMNKIRDRLMKEKRSNVSLRIETKEDVVDEITVSGRGELHLAVLIEAMRREKFELIVSKPQVIIKEIGGQKCEPIEIAYIRVPEEFSGVIIEELSKRKGEMQSINTTDQGIACMEFLIPTRGLIGCMGELLTLTKGTVMLNSIFHEFLPWKGFIPSRSRGVLVAICAGTANPYACFFLQKRGTLFVKPGDDVYEGMIIGSNARENDLIVNITKAKQLNNIRTASKDENILLTPPRVFSLEESMNFIEDDEYLEITPKEIRFRKKHLKEVDRKRYDRTKIKE